MCCVIDGTMDWHYPTVNLYRASDPEKNQESGWIQHSSPSWSVLAQVVCVLSCAHSLLHLCSPIVPDPFPKAEHAACCQKNISG